MAEALKNKRLLIIGGTTGLGFSAARAFIENGARVLIVGRDQTKLTQAQKRLGRNCLGFAADARDPQTAPNAIAMLVAKWKRLDGLYHIAGGSGRAMGDGALHELTDDGWQATLDLNLTSLMFSNRAAIRQFLDQGDGGTILNMGSVLGWSPSPRHFATHTYATAKAGIIGLTKTIASYYASQRIRCNVLAPALVETPMAQRAARDQTVLRFIKTKQPLDGGRIGQPEDLDAAAVYFMSDESKFVTGQVLAVDGGWCLSEGQHG
jgi:NAD(P)-dependent dehydrogenase (short-subunit alcohol dehydrogenase family)